MRNIFVAIAAFLAAGVLFAQTFSFPIDSRLSVTGSNATYAGQYVAWSLNWGFAWGDTVAMRGGYVVASGKCGLPPAPVTSYYPIEDCNGIDAIASTATQIVLDFYSGQCNVMVNRCPTGTRKTVWAMAFNLGTFAWDGKLPGTTASGSWQGQASDPLGRRWQFTETVPGTGVWTVTGGGITPTPTPTAAVPPTRTPTPTLTPSGPTATPYLVCIPVTITPSHQ